MDKPLNCTIKNPANVTLADGKTEAFSGCKVIDVAFPNIMSTEEKLKECVDEDHGRPVTIGEIQFKNYYVAILTIKAKVRGELKHGNGARDSSKWKTCLKSVKLMPDPHSEQASHDYFMFTNKQFCCELKGVISLRFILRQPSPVWKEFRLEDVQLFRASSSNKTSPLPAWLMEQPSEKTVRKPLEGVVDMDQISSYLQQLWALAEEACSAQTTQTLGRFEIQGCYDVNLLAYT